VRAHRAGTGENGEDDGEAEEGRPGENGHCLGYLASSS
jgi:hypothetical protein